MESYLRRLVLLFFIFSISASALQVVKEVDSFATEGLVVADNVLVSSSMKHGSFKFKHTKNDSLFNALENFGNSSHELKEINFKINNLVKGKLENWKSHHRIMGVSFDKSSRRIFFLSPNYLSGSIISFSLDGALDVSVDPDFIVHVTDMGLVNDIKIDNKNNLVIVSNFKSGDIYLFFKEELLQDHLRPANDIDKMGHEIDSANGLYLEGRNLYIVSTSEQVIYKMNIYSGYYDIFSKIDEGFPFSGGWPDDIIRIDDQHFIVSDNKNGGFYLINNDGKLIKKISLVYKGENLVPANMVVHDKKVYFSNLWKANLMDIVLTELSPEDYDFNEYSSGTYSVEVKSIVP